MILSLFKTEFVCNETGSKTSNYVIPKRGCKNRQSPTSKVFI